MNDWDTIEKMVNTLPQWDVIKLIIGIQEELKCAKEDNLYQLRQNKNLQNRIDRTYKYVSQLSSKGRGCEIYANIKKEILNNLKESGE